MPRCPLLIGIGLSVLLTSCAASVGSIDQADAAPSGGETCAVKSVTTARAVASSPLPLPRLERATTFVSVIDGDTIKTSEGTVRLIGVDTPERGACGYVEAAEAIADVFVEGDIVVLELPEGQNDRDKHDRLLRYVSTREGVEVGLAQVAAGHAVARYDSTDGYPAHPYEAEYRAAQTAELVDGGVLTVECRKAAEKAAAEASAQASQPEPTQSAERPWYEQYGSCAQLKRNTKGHPTGPFNVNNPAEADIYTWFAYGTGHRGDGDGDGLACE